MLVSCVLAVLQWASIRGSPFSVLQQGHQHLASPTHFEPELGVAAVAAAVSAAPGGVPLRPAASQLLVVRQQISCRGGAL